jgi:hypothetical protein
MWNGQRKYLSHRRLDGSRNRGTACANDDWQANVTYIFSQQIVSLKPRAFCANRSKKEDIPGISWLPKRSI